MADSFVKLQVLSVYILFTVLVVRKKIFSLFFQCVKPVEPGHMTEHPNSAWDNCTAYRSARKEECIVRTTKTCHVNWTTSGLQP